MKVQHPSWPPHTLVQSTASTQESRDADTRVPGSWVAAHLLRGSRLSTPAAGLFKRDRPRPPPSLSQPGLSRSSR